MLRIRTTFAGTTGAPWLNTLYVGDPNTQANADAAVAAVGAFWGAVDNFMHTSISWATIAEVDILLTTGEKTGSLFTTPQAGAGGTTGDFLPQAIQGLVNLRTGVFIGGREVRGKIFIPGLTEGSNTASGTWLGTQVASVQAAVNTLLTAGDPAFGVWSRLNGSISPAVAGTVTSKWAVLRSRRD
jgi:hypothetical protein